VGAATQNIIMKKNKKPRQKSGLLPIAEVVQLSEAIGNLIHVPIDQLAKIDLGSVPDGLCLWLEGSKAPLEWLERQNDTFLAQLILRGEHSDGLLYSALAIAAKILEKEGYPVFGAAYLDTGKIVRAHWQMEFPLTTPSQELLEAVWTSETAIEEKAKEIMPDIAKE